MADEEDQRYQDANIKAAARAMRQVFVALTREGFTEEQALQIVKSMLPGGSRNG